MASMADKRKIWKAIEASDLSALEKLISDSDDANIVHSDGDRALHKCCEMHFNAAIPMLIARGADAGSSGKDEFTPLMVCAVVDNAEGLRLIHTLTRSAFTVEALRKSLTLAAMHNSDRAAQCLLDFGVDANWQDDDEEGRTALHWAAQEGGTETVSVLLSGGADPNIRDHNGFTPVHTAAAENRADVLFQLIQSGGDISQRCEGDQSSTPLHIACVWENIDAVRVLLVANADRLALNSVGESPIDVAMRTGNQELIGLLKS